MAIEFSTVLEILGVIGIIALIVINIVLYIKNKKDIPEIQDDTIALNLMPGFSKGYAFGFEQWNQKSKSGRYICNFQPIDLKKYKEKGEVKYVLDKPQTIVVGARSRVAIARGDLSAHREFVIYHPKDQAELTYVFKGTMLGDVVDKGVLFSTILDRVYLNNKGMNDAQLNIIKQLKGGELSIEQINLLSESFATFLNNLPQGIFKSSSTTSDKSKKEKSGDGKDGSGSTG